MILQGKKTAIFLSNCYITTNGQTANQNNNALKQKHSMRKLISKIEEKFGKLPDAYRNWLLKGITESDEFDLGDFLEWFSAESVLDEGTDVCWGETPMKGILGLGTCCQNHYWLLDNMRGGRVIENPPGDGKAKLYAPSVEAWIYRACLDTACGFYAEERDAILSAFLKLSTLLEDHNTDWSEHLQYLCQSPVYNVKDRDYCAVIDEKEVNDIILKELGREYLNGLKVDYTDHQGT